MDVSIDVYNESCGVERGIGRYLLIIDMDLGLLPFFPGKPH